MSRRIVIIGGPRVGKSTLSQKLRDELGIANLRCSDDVKHLGWSESSEFASKWFDDQGDWIIEGVQMARALRKWLAANPDKTLDADILTLHQPYEARLRGQESMTKGVFTVFREIQSELVKRGARVHKLKSPESAIGIFSDSKFPFGGIPEERGGMPKFKLKAKIDKLDEVGEQLRGAYVERDGAFHLDPVKLEAIELDNPTELSEALRKERETRERIDKDLKAEREKFKDVDPARYAELVAKAEELEQGELKSKGKIDELMEKQRLVYEKKLEEQKKKDAEIIAGLNAELDYVTVDVGLRGVFEKAGVMTDRIDDAVELTRKKAKREDGKLALYEDGVKLDVSLENYAKEILKEQKPWLFAATGVGGTGAVQTNGQNGNKPTKSVAEWQKMSPQESTDFFKAGGTLTE